MIDPTILQTAADFPFEEGRLIIHQPKCVEIGEVMGEKNFYHILTFLCIEKSMIFNNNHKDLDKNLLDQLEDFDILISMVNQKDEKLTTIKENLSKFFMLLFPNYQLNITEQGFVFINPADNLMGYITKDNFISFRDILKEMFCMNGTQDDKPIYDPEGSMARRMADKFMKARQKVAKMKGEDDEHSSILGRYISVLSVGEQKDKNMLSKYTVYQLYDEFTRFQLKEAYDIDLTIRLNPFSSGSGNSEIEDWRKEIHF